MKVCNLVMALVAAALLATPSLAAVIAYEGFNTPKQATSPSGTPVNAPNNAPLNSILATGTGWDGGWITTNGAGGASKYQTAGLQYPASYPGSNVAVGGNGRVTGAPGDNAFLALNFDAATDAAVNSGKVIYISWLAQNVAKSVSDSLIDGDIDIDGSLPPGDATPGDEVQRTINKLAAEYPRNSGVRLNNGPVGNNGALGMIGNSGNWNGSGGGAPEQSAYGDAELGPEVVDTWGVFNFNDVHNLYTGNNGTQSGPGSPDYNPAPANYDGVDHLVLRVDPATSNYQLWVNLQADGSSDGYLSWIHTDGGVVPFSMHAFGLEAGNGSSNRPVGDMVVDEIYIADTFFSAGGFRAPPGVPEPASAALLAMGLAAFAARRR